MPSTVTEISVSVTEPWMTHLFITALAVPESWECKPWSGRMKRNMNKILVFPIPSYHDPNGVALPSNSGPRVTSILILESKKWIIGPKGKSQGELLTVIMHPKWLRVLCKVKIDCVKWGPGSCPFCDWQLLPVSFSESNPTINDAFFISCWCPTWFDPPRERSRLSLHAGYIYFSAFLEKCYVLSLFPTVSSEIPLFCSQFSL